jgi:hypothetical protein
VADRRETKDVVERAAEALRALPPNDPAAVSRIVIAAARSREMDLEPHVDDLLLAPREPRRSRGALVAALAVAAGIVGFLAGRERLGSTPATPSGGHAVDSRAAGGVAPSLSAPIVSAVARSADMLPVPTQFVFDAARAQRITLVGDFNGWDEHATPLQREDGSSLWSVTVPLTPGRHVYAFLVDSTWTTDPRAPASRDPDFGVTGSVVIVGKP